MAMAWAPSAIPRSSCAAVNPAPSIPAGTMIFASAIEALLRGVGSGAARGDLDREPAVVGGSPGRLHGDERPADAHLVAVMVAEEGAAGHLHRLPRVPPVPDEDRLGTHGDGHGAGEGSGYGLVGAKGRRQPLDPDLDTV